MKKKLASLANLSPSATPAERVRVFEDMLFGKGRKISAVYLRKCYKTLLAEIMEAIAPLKGQALVGGGRGLGKSVFGLLVLLELVAQGFVVVYEHMDSLVLIVDADLPHDVAETFSKLRYEPVGRGIFDLAGDKQLAKALVTVPSVYFVQDLGDVDTNGLSTIDTGKAHWLLLSSPNA